MKILAFSDTHLHKKAIEIIKEKSKDVDILICGGDISIFGKGLKEILKELEIFSTDLMIKPDPTHIPRNERT